MSNNTTNHIIEIYLDHFRAIYSRSNKDLMEQIRGSVEGHAEQISQSYFEVLLSTDEGKKVLNQEIIQSELIPGLVNWMLNLFIIRNNDEDIIGYISQQLEVGKKYVRMNIPPHLCNLGNRVLKMEICNHVINENFSAKETRNIYTQVTMLVDTCLSISLESYIDDKISIEKHSQSLQNHVLGSELAETCQSIRADMHDWHSLLLNKLLLSESVTAEMLPSIKDSDFALWVRHKANVFFKGAEEVKVLNQVIDAIEKKVASLIIYKNNNQSEKLIEAIENINNYIKKTGWLLTSLTKQAHALDSGRDTLTKLYNRRYLDVILQKETSLVTHHNSNSYLLLMIDIDHFKQINDKFGHQAGDNVIESMAGILHDSVRTSDYVFRYGGDEFLILMVDTNLDRAEELARKLQNKVSCERFVSNDDEPISVSISIGIAQHKGESDYMVLINKADQALLQAKQQGRNCFILAA